MKARLMFRDRDFDPAAPLPPGAAALRQDLGLETLFAAMAEGDAKLAEVAEAAVLAVAGDLPTIRYRQAVLRDCLDQPQAVRALHALSVEAIEAVRKHAIGGSLRFPQWVLRSSVDAMQLLVEVLRRLRALACEHGGAFRSEGFTRLFAMLSDELTDDYFQAIRDHLARLRFRDGVLVSAGLGVGGKGCDYVLRAQKAPAGNWLQRVLAPAPPGYSFELAERDDAGARALSELQDRGINLVANALAQSTDHVVAFFAMLRTELAFYVGALNLHAKLTAQGEGLCVPEPVAAGERRLAAAGLYDPCLALHAGHRVVGNDLAADGCNLVMITGANQGGKSTFLRAVGVAQLMMQCGLFVAAGSFRAELCAGLFSHYKREEDAAMNSGKFDEELHRMSGIVDHLLPDSLVLFNESFAATNEREGSEIARQIVTALLARRMKVVFVTHQYPLAQGFHEREAATTRFLRAERDAQGARHFQLVEGAPLRTSYGPDLYRRIFADAGD